MSRFYLFMGLTLVLACEQNKSQPIASSSIIPNIYISKTSKEVVFQNDVVFVNGKPFSGFLFELIENSKDTISIEGFQNGLLEGKIKKWYPTKQLIEVRYYSKGKKNGLQIAYWENGNKKFEFTAKDDAYEGELKEWTFDGKLIHLGTYIKGQENGPQKLWYDNGKIRANYVIIYGKRYGLLGTKNCKNVSDSIFIIK